MVGLRYPNPTNYIHTPEEQQISKSVDIWKKQEQIVQILNWRDLRRSLLLSK